MPFLSHGLFIRTLAIILGPIYVLGSTSEEDLTKSNFFSWLLPKLFSFNQSNTCYKDLLQVAIGLFRLEQWALTNAVGKPEANLLGGNYGWVGNYEQCIGIKRGLIEGQHCWIKITQENTTNNLLSDGIQLVGICLPNSCKNKDFEPITNSIKEMVNKASSMLPFNASLAPSIDCEYSHIHYTMTSYVAIGIGCILLLFVFLGTSVDVLSGSTRDSGKKVHLNGKNMEIKNRTKKLCAGFNRFVLLFSCYSNGRKLFALDKESSDVTFSQLNGLKVIAMAGVIFNHTFLFFFTIAKNPVEAGAEWRTWLLQLFLQVQFVDTFFLITGFLTLHGVVRKPPLQAKARYICDYFLRRYFKMLVAPLTIVVLTQVVIRIYFSSGPIRKFVDINCSNHWWHTIFFLDDYLGSDQTQCFTTGWFIAATVQLHLISLIVIVPLIYKKYSWSILSGSALLVVSWSWLAWKAHHIGLHPLYPEEDNLKEFSTYFLERDRYHQTLYWTPIFHLGPYLVGMGLAWFLFKHGAGLSLTKAQVRVGWLLSSIGLYVTVYLIYMRPNRMWRSVHMIFGPTLYGLSLAWVVFICNSKNNGVVSRMLRWKYWLPLSRLNLSAYLIQHIIVFRSIQSEYDKINYSTPLILSRFVANWLVTYPVATVLTLCIEMPFGAIVDALFR